MSDWGERMLFDNPLFDSWYTDTVDIYRVENVMKDSVTVQERVKQNETPVPCRIYFTSHNGPQMRQGAGKTEKTEKLACNVTVEIKAGDELRIVRGGNSGVDNEPERYFAGKPQPFYDPVGGALSGLEHLEVAILTDEINK